MPSPRLRLVLGSRRAFTLIELLVVITIIGVLAGLLLPVVSKVLNNANKTQTRAAESQIVASVNSFQTDYGVYPIPSPAPATPVDKTYTSANGNAALFNILRALDNGVTNTRQVVYFEGNNAKNPTSPKSGFATQTGNYGNKATGAAASVNVGDFLDAWGNEYCIRIDSGYTNAVINPYYTPNEADGADDTALQPLTSTNNAPNAAGQAQCLLTGVIVWSYGVDGVLGTYKGTTAPPPTSDDVISWQ